MEGNVELELDVLIRMESGQGNGDGQWIRRFREILIRQAMFAFEIERSGHRLVLKILSDLKSLRVCLKFEKADDRFVLIAVSL
jgi:hypothetical protein